MEEQVQEIQFWLEKCEKGKHAHSECNYPSSKELPGRLIELYPKTGMARLVDTPQIAPSYIALSYVWGDPEQNLRTTEENWREMYESIPCDRLPQTLKDVFKLVLALDKTYLWVDALCIIQGDTQDWKNESKKMGAIYSNAYVVISAMASRGVTNGLSLGQSAYWTEEKAEFHRIMRTCRTLSQRDWGRLATDFPLLCRGWAFQERLLARRVVHFTALELVWECKEDRWCPCGGSINDITSSGKINNMSSAFKSCLSEPADDKLRPMWRECVTSFSKRNLTVPTDRLAAISGVARLLRQPEYDERFLEGLWTDALPSDLLWYCDQTSRLSQKRLSTPSWSWISVDCGIEWPKRKRGLDEEALRYISSATYFEHGFHPRVCSANMDGEIVLQTRIIPVYFGKDQGHNYGWIFKAPYENSSLDWRTSMSMEDTLSCYPDILLSEGKCFFLEIFAPISERKAWQIGLIVQRCEDCAKYTRVGLAGDVSCDPGKYSSSWFDGENKQEIVLV